VSPVVVCRPSATSPNREVGGSRTRDTDVICTPTLNAVEALAIGQTLRTLARDKRTPLGLREMFAKVGSELAVTGQLALTQHRSAGQ
jgi:hypothetical protein